MRRRFPLFFIVATLILGGAYTYVAWRVAAGVAGWLAIAVPFVLIWLMPVLFWSRSNRSEHSAFARAFQWASFVSMALVSFLVVLTLARDVLLLAVPGTLEPGFVIFGALALTALGALLAFTGPRVKDVTVPIADLPPELEGFRIAQISDLHVGPTIRTAYVRRVVAKTNALGADAVALTGDIVDGDVNELTPHIQAFAEFMPKGHVYFVTGNHEYYWNAPAWLPVLRGLGLTVLTNENVMIERGGAKLLIGGIVDPASAHTGGTDRPDVAAAARGDAAVKILLAHQPGIAEQAAAAGFALQLSGHTHAGQFFPWTLVVRFFHKHYAGLSRSGGMWVYVSPGTGTWGPPVRLGTVPEITLIKLVRAR